MKRIVIAMMLLVSSSALAQSTAQSSMKIETESPSYSGEKISKGIRFDLVKSFLNVKSDLGFASNQTNQDIGFALGYASIREHQLGYTADAQYDIYSNGLATARVEGNATIGFREIGYAFLGPNVSTIATGVTKSTPGIGFQVGLGANVQENVGFSFGYVMTKSNVRDNNGFSSDMTLSGIEVKLHATF